MTLAAVKGVCPVGPLNYPSTAEVLSAQRPLEIHADNLVTHQDLARTISAPKYYCQVRLSGIVTTSS
jgi:hypothetical protein